jgi:hypothetical protein
LEKKKTAFAASNHDIPLCMTHMPVNRTGDFGSGDFGDFNPAQYGGVQPHHHHSSTHMIVDTGDNSNSTAGSDDFNSAQYGWLHQGPTYGNEFVAEVSVTNL